MSGITKLPTAVLIDGENIAAGAYPELEKLFCSFPGIAIMRVFGDFSKDAHAAWMPLCREKGLEPVLNCSPANGRNGTDILMSVAAMDLLAGGIFRRIMLVSSDSDFLPLARRLRSGGIEVVGIGNRPLCAQLAAAYSSWMMLGKPAAKGFHKSKPGSEDGSPDEFSRAIDRILGDSAVSLARIGQDLHDREPELAKQVRGKLKKRIERAGIFSIDGDKVSRAA